MRVCVAAVCSPRYRLHALTCPGVRTVQARQFQRRMMAQAGGALDGSARSHWWNMDIETEAVMWAVRLQSERGRTRPMALRIPS